MATNSDPVQYIIIIHLHVYVKLTITFDMNLSVEARHSNITTSPYEIGADITTTSFFVSAIDGSMKLPFTRISTCGTGMPTALHRTTISLLCSSEQNSVDVFQLENIISLVFSIEEMFSTKEGEDCANMGGTV